MSQGIELTDRERELLNALPMDSSKLTELMSTMGNRPNDEVADLLVTSTMSYMFLNPLMNDLRHLFRDDQEFIQIINKLDLDPYSNLYHPPNASAYEGAVAINMAMLSQHKVLARLLAFEIVKHPRAASIRDAALYRYRVEVDKKGVFKSLAQLHKKQIYREFLHGDLSLARALINNVEFKFDPSEYEENDSWLNSIEKAATMVNDAFLTWVILHEVGHHALGHIGEVDSDSDSEANKVSCKTASILPLDSEKCADRYAFMRVHRKVESIALLGPYLQLLTEVEQAKLDGGFTPASTHPTWRERYEVFKRIFPNPGAVTMP